jgi:hypothetical protein
MAAKDPHDVQLAFIHMLRAKILGIPRAEFVERACNRQADVYPLLSPLNVRIMGKGVLKDEDVYLEITPYKFNRCRSLNTKHNKTLNMEPFVKSSLRVGLGKSPAFCQTSVEYYEYYNKRVQFDGRYKPRFNIVFYESLYVEMQRIEMELVKHVSNVTIYLADFYAEALLNKFAIVDKQTETAKKMEIDKKDSEGETSDQKETIGTRNRIKSQPIVKKFTEALKKAKGTYSPNGWDILHDIPDVPPSHSKKSNSLVQLPDAPATLVPDESQFEFLSEIFRHGGHQQPEPYPLAGPAGPAEPAGHELFYPDPRASAGLPVQTIDEEDLAELINYQDVDTLVDDYVPPPEEDPDSVVFTEQQLAELEDIIAQSQGE